MTRRYGLANLYKEMGNLPDACRLYEHALELNPKKAKLYGGLGDVYNALGETDKAILAYEKAIELDPDDAYSRGSLAGIFRKLGRQADYEMQITRARQLMAHENKYNRACFESICGNVAEALVLLRAALNLGQIDASWVERDPDFDFIRDDPGFQALIATYKDKTRPAS